MDRAAARWRALPEVWETKKGPGGAAVSLIRKKKKWKAEGEERFHNFLNEGISKGREDLT